MSIETKRPQPESPQVEVEKDLEELESAAEDDFYALAETADPDTRKTGGFKRALTLAEDEGKFKTALEQLRTFLEARNATLDEIRVSNRSEGLSIDKEGLRQLVQDIRLALAMPDAFLGNGSVAEVHSLRYQGIHLCVKWVHNYERYAEGGHTVKEIGFMDELRDLEVQGVRAPRPFFAFASHRMDGIVMEQLNATNFRRVIEEQVTEGIPDKLPEPFNVDVFFNKLEAYVRAMHKRGIFHGDLHLRNIMIDRETGNPYLIDFGKGRYEWEQDRESNNPTDYAANDLESLRLAKHEAKRWIIEQASKTA